MKLANPPATMKKFLIAAIALGSLGLTACTSEEEPTADDAKEAAEGAADAAKDAADK